MSGSNCLGEPLTERFMHHLFGDEGSHASGKFPKMVILGRTKHVTKCQNCGREGLKSTVVCSKLGDDGHPTSEYFYFGTDCASKIAGKPEKDIDAEADDQESKGRPRVSKPKSVKPNEGQQELALRFQAAMNEAIVERFAARHGFEELLAKAAKYREYGEHYNRNIHASASRLDEMLAQGRHEEAARWADELRLRLESLEPKPQTDLLGQPVKPAPKPKAVFDSNKGKQQSLFAGLNAKEGQMNLFADDGVPDELVAKPQPPAQKELFEAVREALVERFAARQSPWYLRSGQLLTQKMGHAAPASQVLAMLRNNQVNPEELQYTGIEQYLQSKGSQTVSQQELHAILGQFNVGETVLGDKHLAASPELRKHHDELSFIRGYPVGYDNDLVRHLEDFADVETDPARELEFLRLAQEAVRLQGQSGVKYKRHTLPGGKNYREMLLTLPEKRSPVPSYDEVNDFAITWLQQQFDTKGKRFSDSQAQVDEMKRDPWGWSDLWIGEAKRHFGVDGGMYPDHRKKKIEVEGQGNLNHHNSHWDQPNVLAHVRYNDRIGPDGKRHLHIEEIQSDWHQAGRKHGYATPSSIEIKPRQIDGKTVFTIYVNGRAGLSYETQEAAQRYARSQPGAGEIPDAPFKNSWRMLAMKRMIDHAVRNGYDRITWTPGQEQADRYEGLQQHVKQVSTVKQPDGRYLTYVETPNGRYANQKHGFSDNGQGTFTHEQLAELFGHHTAQHLVQGADAKALERAQLRPDERSRFEEWHDLYPSSATGHPNGLKIGGHKMRKAYDEILPQETARLIKKHGGKVGQFDLHLPQVGDSSGGDIGHEPARSIKAHGFDITPQMRESVIGKGQSLFSIFGDEDLAVDRYENTEPKPAIPTGQLDSHVHWEMPEFKSWFGKSKAVTPAGKPLRLFHGTKRPDRIGAEFKASRATSGPMPFFTDDPEIASSYATNKQDTSIDMPESYSQWFKYKVPGSKREVDLDNAWHHLPMEQRKLALERLPHVNTNEEGAISHKHGQGTVASDWDWYLKREGGGNPLKAARYLWLDSGHLFSDESRFLEVLKHAGIDHNQFRMESPWHEQPGVYPVWLSVQNPLDTSNIPDHVHTALHLAGRLKRGKAGDGADQWDKRHVSGPEWLDRLASDRQQGTTHAWTSIPDWVTKTLRSFGYDGIQDRGGKYTNHGHNVWIPFSPHQIKSAVGNRGTFDSGKKKIIYASEGQPERFQTPARNQHGFVSFRLGSGMQALEGPKAPEPPKRPGSKLLNAIRSALSKGKQPQPSESSKKESFGLGNRLAEVLTERFSTPYTLRSSKLIAEKAQDNQLASQVLAMLRNNQVSQDELKWTGLEKRLAELGNQRVNKSELQEMLSKIRLKETMLSDDPKESWNSVGTSPKYRNIATPIPRNYRELLLQWEPEHVRNATYEPVNQIPEGSVSWLANAKDKHPLEDDDWRVYLPLGVQEPPPGRHRADYVAFGKSKEEAEQKAVELWNKHLLAVSQNKRPPEGYVAFTQSHHPLDNILAHVRLSDSNTSSHALEGLEAKVRSGQATPEEMQSWRHHRLWEGPKTLHIEEIQSDWHNKGRNHGFVTPDLDSRIQGAQEELEYHKRNQEKDAGRHTSNFGPLPKNYQTLANVAYRLHLAQRTKYHDIPDAPMASSITPAVLRKLVHYAVQNGYERITWAPGWEQGRRYPGGVHEVHHIEYNPRPRSMAIGKVPGVFHGHELVAFGKKGQVVSFEDLERHMNHSGLSMGFVHDQIATAFGKEVADAIYSGKGKAAPRGWKRITLPTPVRFGHEVGLRQLYDKEMPKHVMKVIKPHGGQLQEFHMTHLAGYNGRHEAKRDRTPGRGRKYEVVDRATGNTVVSPMGVPLNNLSKSNATHASLEADMQPQSSKVMGFDITPAMKAHYQKEGPQLFALELSNDWSGERFGWNLPQEPYGGPLEAPRESKKLSLGEKIAQQLLGKRAQGVSVREAILPERKAKRHGSIIGRQLHSDPARHAEELGKLAQRYRNPRYETFRAVYLRGNQVVGVNAISHRHPSFVMVGQHASKLYEDAHKLGADKVWMVHNHPTGDATPSLPDHRTTRNFQDYFDRWNQQAKDQGFTHQVNLVGHVITNHDHFTHFGPYNGHGDHQRVSLNKPGSTMMQHVHDGVQHHRMGQVINGPDEVAQMAWNIHKNPHQAVVALVNTKHKLRALLDIDAKHLTHPDPTMGLKTLGAIRRMHRKLGTLTGFLFLPPGMKPEHINHQLRSHGAFLDMVEHGAARTYGQSVGGSPDHDVMDVYAKAKHPMVNKVRVVKPESVGDKFTAAWDASTERYAARRKAEQRWRLRSADALRQMPEMAPASQIWGTLVNQGISPEELKWTGLERSLKAAGNQPVSRDQLLKQASAIRVIEQMAPPDVLGRNFTDYMYENGSNPFELILQLPPGYRKAIGISHPVHLGNEHWFHDNVVAHMRAQDMNGIDGKRHLHLEELQSDWHQAGRDSGYNDGKPPSEREMADYFNANTRKFEAELPFDVDGVTWQSLSPAYRRDLKRPVIREMQGDMIPSAPFGNNWHMLLMKRAIQHAAENGHDRISWPIGSEHAGRYSLSRKFHAIGYHPESQSLYFKQTTPAGNISSWQRVPKKVPADRLHEYIGRGVSKRLLESQPQATDLHGSKSRPAFAPLHKAHVLTGEELSNEHGMEWYDTAVVNHTNNLLKKLGGGRVYRSKVNAGQSGHRDVHAFDITPEMKAKVSGGVSLFSVVSDDDLELDRFGVEGVTERYFLNAFQGWADKQAGRIGNAAAAINRAGEKLHGQLDEWVSRPGTLRGKATGAIDNTVGKLMGPKPKQLPYKPISGIQPGTSVWLNGEHKLGSGGIIPHMTRGTLVRETDEHHARVDIDGKHYHLPKQSLYYAFDPSAARSAIGKATSSMAESARRRSIITGRSRPPEQTPAVETELPAKNEKQIPEKKQHDSFHDRQSRPAHQVQKGDLVHIPDGNGGFVHVHANDVQVNPRTGRVKIFGNEVKFNPEAENNIEHTEHQLAIDGNEKVSAGVHRSRSFLTSRLKGKDGPVEAKDYDQDLVDALVASGLTPEQAVQRAREQAAMQGEDTPAASRATPSQAPKSQQADPVPKEGQAEDELSKLLASHAQPREDRLPIHHLPHAEFVGGDGERSGVFAINKATGDVVLRYNGQNYPVTLNPNELVDGKIARPKAIRNRIHQAEAKKAYLAGEELPEHTRDHWEQHLPRWAREKAAAQSGGVSPQGEAEAKPPLTSYAKNGPGGTGRSGAPKPQAPDFSSLPKQPPEDEPPEAPAFNPDAPENDPFSPSYVPPPETPQQQQSNRKIRVDAGVLGALREHAAGNRSGTTYVLEHAIHDMFPGSSPQVLQLLKNHVKAHHAGELNAIRQLLARKQKIQDTLPKGNTKEGRILSQKIKAGTDLHSLRNYIPNYDLIAESLSQEFPAFFAGDDRDEKVLAYLTRKDWGRQSWNDLVDRFWSDMPPQYKQDILYMSENPDAFQVIDLPDVGDNRDREQNNRWQETVPFELAAHNRLVERFSSGWQAGVPDRGKINQGPNRSKGAARGSEAATSNTKAILVERLRRR